MERLIWRHFLLFFFLCQSASSSPLSSSPSSNHSCSLDERSSLLQFKQMFSVESFASSQCDYPKTLSWKETTDLNCCSWDGVTCDVFTGHVTGLDLSCSKLYGTIHPNTSLFQLSHLQQLNLANNHFNFSPISPSFSRFRSLSHLDLSSSFLSGSIPSEIAHLSKLISLDLSDNFMDNMSNTGALRLEPHNFKALLMNLTQVETLKLSNVNISSGLPESLLNLSSLVELDLSYTELSGPLPESLGNLTRIAVLRLSGNYLKGRVPSSLSNLEQLTHFSVSRNNIDGTIPEFFSKLMKLEYLYLDRNNFNGPVPRWVSNLTQLVSFSISSNPLTGPIPNYNNISGFGNLQTFDLSNCSLTGTLPSWLFAIPSLQFLILHDNQLTGQIPEFRHDSQLIVFYLGNNKLRGPIPQSISGLANLRELYLSSNNLSGVVELQKFSKLERLDLSSNSISVSIGSNANATWPNLYWLALSSCNITESLEFFKNAKNLQILDLYNNQLAGEIPSSICNLSFLRILVLSNNNLNGVIPHCLGNVNNDLEVLDLQMNGFHGAIPAIFAKGSNLRSLHLNGNRLQGQVPRSLANCISMEVLDLGNNDLYGTFPHWLESLPKLQVLVLKSNKFHGPILTSGTESPFPKLRILDLSHNNFIGLLPETYFLNFKALMNVGESTRLVQYMGDTIYRDSVELVLKGNVIEMKFILTVFTTIDLSCNNFRGEIPNDIGKLQGLRLMNLSHNSLSGNLPSLLANLTLLESLDLSSNQLNGEIPGVLTSLTFLAVLNLSKNHLVGRIPEGNQFNTFQNDSYVGNSGLCGLPLSKKCGGSEPQQPISQDDDGDDFASGFTWRIVLMGYGCGFVIGVSMGCVMFLTGRPKWFTRRVGGEGRRKVVRINQIGWRRTQRS